MVSSWVRKLTDGACRKCLKRGEVALTDVAVGREYMYRPPGRRARRIRIIEGAYWGTYGVSNFWTWRYVLAGGRLGREQSDYGGYFYELPKKRRKP